MKTNIQPLDPMLSIVGRVQRLPASMIKDVIVGVVGEQPYFKVLEELDKAIAHRKELDKNKFRKGSAAGKMEESLSLRTSMLREMQARKKYSKSKTGQFLQRYAPYVHEMRTSSPAVPWQLIEKYLRGKGFRASIQLIKDCYKEYLMLLNRAKESK